MATIQDILKQAFGLHHAGNLRQAEILYRRVLDAEPNNAHALCNLGVLINQAERPDEAIDYLRRAVALQPEVGEVHNNLAMAYLGSQDVRAGVAEFREALRLKPSSARLHVQLGQALLELGELDEALALAKEATRLEPGFPAAFGMLGQLAGQDRYTLSDDEIRQIEAILQGRRLSLENAVALHFTLAGYHDRKGETDAAFRNYQRANELQREIYRRSGRPFNRQQHTDQIDTLMAAFTPDFFERAQGAGADPAHWHPPFGNTSERPVFVVGMVRSGTSLVEQILASHPRVFGCGELKNMGQIASSFYTACMQGIDAATVDELAERYLRRLGRDCGPEALRVIDKMPHNYLHLGAIAVLFPRARVIHCRRDPMDTCVSAFVQPFNDIPYATSLEDLGFYYREYERMMAHWRNVLPLPVYEVVYEELVAEPERVSQEMIIFCGLEWDERCMRFHDNPRAVRTMSKLQVRQPVYRHAVAKWKRFEAYLQPLREALAGREKPTSPSPDGTFPQKQC
jgi:tetratricopeptide (TPR) repeat protein